MNLETSNLSHSNSHIPNDLLNVVLKDKPELYVKQCQLEIESRQLGAERYNRMTNDRASKGNEENTTYGQQLIRNSVVRLASHIDAWKEELENKKVARKGTAYKYLRDLHSEKVALITLQVVLKSLSKETMLLPLQLEVASRIEDQVRVDKLAKKDRRLVTYLIDRCKDKIDYKYKHDAIVKAASVNETETGWSKNDKTHIGSLLVSLVIENIGIIQCTTENNKGKTNYRITATPKTMDFVKRHREIAQYMSPTRDPMVVPPVPWEKGIVKGCGYLTKATPPLDLVKGAKSKGYREELKHVDMPEVITAVNAAQETPWRINHKVYEIIQQLMLGNSELGKLPRAYDLDPPPKPHDIDTNEDAKLEYRKKARKTYVENNKHKSRRIGIHLLLAQVERFKDFDKIYFPHQLDFRGRVYSATNGGLSPQGADWSKGMIEFAEGKRIGAEGIPWLKVHIANLFGVDKVSFEERIKWVDDHTDDLFNVALDPLTYTFWDTADKKFQALAACYEYASLMVNGEDHITRIPIALDGSCSGLQNLGMALRCEVTGKSVNLIPQEQPADIYSEVARKVVSALTDCNSIVTNATHEEATKEAEELTIKHLMKDFKCTRARALSALERGATKTKLSTKDKIGKAARDFYYETFETWAWLKFGIDRKTCKRSVMTFPYGSETYGFSEQLRDDILKPAKAQCETLLTKNEITLHEYRERFPFSDDGFRASSVLARHLFAAVTETVQKAAEVMKWMQSVAKLVAEGGRPISWRTPLGFPVQQIYYDTKLIQVKTWFCGKTYKPKVATDSSEINVTRMANGISPNVVHSLDANHLMKTVYNAYMEDIKSFALIHDSFGTYACDTPRFFQIIREAFVELYKENPFIDLYRQFERQVAPDRREEIPALPSEGNLDITQVIDSSFAFA